MHSVTLLSSTEVAALIRNFLRPLRPLAPKVRVDRKTRAIHVSFTDGRLTPPDHQRLAMLLNSFSGHSLDFSSGGFQPVDRYFPGLATPFRFENPHVFLHGPETLTPNWTYIPATDIINGQLSTSRQLPWCSPKP